jgi:uncharacterized membrane protein
MENNLSRDIIHIIVRNSDCPAEGVDKALTENVYAGRMQWTKFLNLLLVALGVAFTFSGIVFFFAYNWDDLHRFAKMGMVAALLVACVSVAALSKTNRTHRNIALTVSALLVGALFAVFGQVYQTGADTWELFFIWTIFIAAWVVTADFAPLWLLFLTLVNATVMYCGEYIYDTILLYDILFVINAGDDTILLYNILFVINAGFVIAFKLLPSVGRLRRKPDWLLYTLSLAAVLAITLAIITSIRGIVANGWSYLLATVFVLGTYTMGFRYGIKHRNTFYLIVVAVSIIAIVSTLLITVIDDLIESTLVTGLFIIGSTIAGIYLIINLNKQWHGNKQ